MWTPFAPPASAVVVQCTHRSAAIHRTGVPAASPAAHGNRPEPPAGRSVKNLRMIWRFASRYRLQIAGAAAALIVAAAATSGVPYAFKLIIDKGFAQGGSTSDIARWFEYLLMLVGVMALATAVRYYFVSWLGERTVADIRLAVHRNLLRLSPGFFEENRPAEITSRITVDTTIIEQVVGTTVSVALRNIVLAVACIVILFVLSPKLAGLMLLGLPLVARPDHLARAGECGKSRHAARTASPTSAPSPAKCWAR